MENALLIGLSRQMSLQRELDVVANNIANINTTAFKADGAIFQEYLMPVARDNQFTGKDARMSFVQDRATWHDLAAGPVQQTGNPLDVAIDGKGYLVVQTPAGERYTRNGALQLNATGELVTGEGYRVLGDAGPIQFQAQDRGIMIGEDGSIRVREGVAATTDAARGKLRVVSFDNPGQLQKDGGSNYKAPTGMTANPIATPRVVQGSIEKSNVRSVLEMTRMIEVTRNYTEVAGILKNQSDLRRDSIQKLSDIPA